MPLRPAPKLPSRASSLPPTPLNECMNALFVPSSPLPPTPVPNTLPRDFPPGTLLRIGPNGSGEGFLDGQGFIASMTVRPDPEEDVLVSRAWVRSKGFVEEEEKGEEYGGTLKANFYGGLSMLSTLASNFVRFGGYPQKDTSNTALSLHPLSPGRVLARMEQSLPTELTVSKGGEVATVLPFSTLGGTLPLTNPISGGALSAHSRTCPETGETFSISYGTTPPFLRLDRYTPPGSHSSHPIPVPAPVFLHDLELTPSYVVVLDLPLTVRPSRLAFNAFPVAYEPSNGARVGLFSRKTSGVEWWEVEACVVLHCAGAAEAADGSVTLRALRSVPDGDRSYIQSYTPAYLHEWRIGPEKGAVTERRLSDVMMEFPVPCGSDGAFLALRVRSIEGPLLLHCSPETGVLLDGVVKFDGSGRQVATYDAEDGWWCVSEPTVCGKYATVMVSNVAKDVGSYGDGFDGMATKVVVLDLESLEKVAEQEAAKTGYGLHSLWLPWDSHVEESNEV